jgi:hypothetical protein
VDGRGGSAETTASLPAPPVPAAAGGELDLLSAQLREKTRNLLVANLSQTKYFFRKLKKYIDFLSTPSESVAECRCVGRSLVQVYYS